MTLQCTAIVEKGLLRPVVPVSLPDGTQVDLIIQLASAGAPRRNPAEILADIAALPVEPAERTFSAREHDEVLYRK